MKKKSYFRLCWVFRFLNLPANHFGSFLLVVLIIYTCYNIIKYIYFYRLYSLKVIFSKGDNMFQGMKYVYEVYKEKSFSKAAASLFISQPSLSANVKRIENRIGSPICWSSRKIVCGVKLFSWQIVRARLPVSLSERRIIKGSFAKLFSGTERTSGERKTRFNDR